MSLFNLRSRWLLVHGADPLKWARRYEIEPFSHPCYYCGVVQSTTIPFAAGGLRGMVAPSHECHGQHREPPYCVVAPGSSGLEGLFPAPMPTHRSKGVVRTYRVIAGQKGRSRRCGYSGCRNKRTHQGFADGVCVTNGCQWHMAAWARECNRHVASSPRSAG